MRRLALLLLLPLALTIAAACSSDDADSADPLGGRSTTTDRHRPDSSSDVPKPELRLLDAGSAPRVQVQLDPPGDCLQRTALTQEQSIRQEISGTGDADDAPDNDVSTGTEFDADYRCTRVRADAIDYEIEYAGGRVLHGGGGASSPIRELIKSLVGQSQAMTVDRHGRVLEFETPTIDLGDDELDEMIEGLLSGLGDSVQSGSAVLPSEPVGVGARWTVTAVASAAGFRMRSTMDYVVTEIDADHLATTVTQTLEPIPGALDLPGMPEGSGVEAEIVSGHLEGSGTFTWDLHGVAAFFDQTVEGEVTLAVREGRNHAEIRQTQRMHQKMVPRD